MHRIKPEDIIPLLDNFSELDLRAPVVNHLSDTAPLQQQQPNVDKQSQNSDTAQNNAEQTTQTKLEQLGIKINNAHLTESQNQELRDLVESNSDIFTTSMANLPGMIGYEHSIDTYESCPPIRRRAYSANPQMQKELSRQIQEMLNNNIIEQSSAIWNSPAFLVRKASGELRFVVDFRQLNRVMKPTFFPLPSMKDIQQTLGEASPTIFSSLDLRQGFYQIGLTPETRDKSTFITHEGSFRFCRIPMGLASSPQAFLLAMLKVFRGMTFKHTIY